ncbi:MAG: hypothetical protein K6G40_02230 [Eubacterium sp.]|nr:hypothetical protein [Eubacterium sp.]
MDIKEFVENDKAGHKKMSEEEIKKHLAKDSGFSIEEKESYFRGIVTMFPAMMLGHYFEFITGESPERYMKEFVPSVEKLYMETGNAMLHTVYENYGNKNALAAFLGAYFSYYPVQILMDFAGFALSNGENVAAEKFIFNYRKDKLPTLLKEIGNAVKDKENSEDYILYLATEYPFDLVEDFHNAVFK